MTAKAYAKKLRNRIRALKLRIRKKEEDQELQILRKMAKRLNLLHNHNLLSRAHSEALMEEDEKSFYVLLNKMRQRSSVRKRLHKQAFLEEGRTDGDHRQTINADSPAKRPRSSDQKSPISECIKPV